MRGSTPSLRIIQKRDKFPYDFSGFSILVENFCFTLGRRRLPDRILFFSPPFFSLSLPLSIVKNSDVGKFRIRAEFEIFQTSVNFARERMRANLKYPRVKGRIVLVLRETNF